MNFLPTVQISELVKILFSVLTLNLNLQNVICFVKENVSCHKFTINPVIRESLVAIFMNCDTSYVQLHIRTILNFSSEIGVLIQVLKLRST